MRDPVLSPSDHDTQVGDRQAELVRSILSRLRGRFGMNARTGEAYDGRNSLTVDRACARVDAYTNAIADVLAAAKDAGLDVE